MRYLRRFVRYNRERDFGRCKDEGKGDFGMYRMQTKKLPYNEKQEE